MVALAITAAVVGLIALLVLFRPAVTGLAFAVVLPAYFLVSAALYGPLAAGGASTVYRGVEELIVASSFLGLVVVGLYRSSAFPSKWVAVDLALGAWLAINVSWLVAAGPAGAAPFKTNIMWAAVYFLGRVTPGTDRTRNLTVIVCLLAVTGSCVVAIGEMSMQRGLPETVMMGNFLEREYGQPVTGNHGLSWTFETSSGRRRYSGLSANPLDLAASIVVLAPFLVLQLAKPRRSFAHLGWWVVALTWTGALWAAHSRAAMGATVVVAVLSVRALAGSWAMLRLGALVALAGTLILVSSAESRDYFVETVTFRNPSAAGHAAEWLAAGLAIRDQPWGHGLGTSGLAGGSFAGVNVGGENQALVYGVDLGVMGMLVYLAALTLALSRCLRRGDDASLWSHSRRSAGYALLGLALIGLTAEVHTYLFATLVTWWLVGQVVVSDSGRQARSTGAAAPPVFRAAPGAV